MDYLNFNKLKDLFKNKVLAKIDRKILVYLVFVGISTVFWFLNKLSNEFSATINYPVKYTNVPKQKVLTSELPEKLKLHVNADGFTLLKIKLSPIPFPVVINLSDFNSQISGFNIQHFTLQTRSVKSEINHQLGKEIEVLDIYPDTISFNFANIVSRKVPLSAKVDLTFAQQCMLDGKITFQPDSITVSGPANILDTLQFVYNKSQKLKGLNKPIQRNVALTDIDHLSLSKKRVIMYVPVSKFTELNVEVPIRTKNVPDSLELITFPQKAKITYVVSLNNGDKITDNDFILEVDYNELEKLLGQKMSVNLSKQSTYAQSVSYSPVFVEYIIEKRND